MTLALKRGFVSRYIDRLRGFAVHFRCILQCILNGSIIEEFWRAYDSPNTGNPLLGNKLWGASKSLGEFNVADSLSAINLVTARLPENFGNRSTIHTAKNDPTSGRLRAAGPKGLNPLQNFTSTATYPLDRSLFDHRQPPFRG